MSTWARIRDEVVAAATGIDPARIAATDAVAMLPVLTQIKNAVAAVEAAFAIRVAQTDRWRVDGARDAADHVARHTGVSRAQAQDALDVGRMLGEVAPLREAALRGELSQSEAAAIAGVARVAPACVPRLLDQATQPGASLRELRDACAAATAAADPDPEATRQRIHRTRSVWSRRDRDGAQILSWRDNPERIAAATAGLADLHQALFEQARREGRRERPDALEADALYLALTAGGRGHGGGDIADGAALAGSADRLGAADEAGGADAAGGAGLPRRLRRRRSRGVFGDAKILVRLDVSAAVRGRAVGAELAEIAGSGPVAVSAVEEMRRGGAALALVATDGVGPRAPVVAVAHVPRPVVATTDLRDEAVLRGLFAQHGRAVAGVVHAGRRPTAWQQTALQWVSPTCSATGCTALRCEMDHRTGWAVTRTTRLEDLDRLCRFHHHLKTRSRWQLEPGVGKRAFRPPRVVQPRAP